MSRINTLAITAKGLLANADRFRMVALALLLLLSTRSHALDQFEGYTGLWLRNDHAEAFVAIEPRFRLLAFRTPGGESLMAGKETPSDQGLRLAFMGPDQVKTSFDVGNQKGSVVEQSPMSARIRLEPADGLQYEVSIALNADAPAATLTYQLTNLGQVPRAIGCWSVISYPCDGVIVIPFGDKPRARKRLVMPWWTHWPQPGFTFGRDTLVADTTKPTDETAHKVGVITEAGWIAFVKGTSALVSKVSFEPGVIYPEDGANITMYQQVRPDGVRAETEQMSSLRSVEPGESISMAETLTLRTLDKPASTDQPDALRALLEKP